MKTKNDKIKSKGSSTPADSFLGLAIGLSLGTLFGIVTDNLALGMMIGVSAHTVEEAKKAVAHGADCLGVGAVFSTNTKTDVDVLPRQTLIDICTAVDVPVVAIGGIHKENILQLKGTGVDGVALVSAIFGAEDIEAECKELKALSEQIVK